MPPPGNLQTSSFRTDAMEVEPQRHEEIKHPQRHEEIKHPQRQEETKRPPPRDRNNEDPREGTF